MARLNKTTETGESFAFLSKSVNMNENNDLNKIRLEITTRRQPLLLMIKELSSKIIIDAKLVHDLNFHVTEYVFWSHFIFSEKLSITEKNLKNEMMDQTVALSYLTSAIQYVPESKSALSHFISRFTDRFDLEDKAMDTVCE